MDRITLRNKLIIESYFNIKLPDDYNYSNILELVNSLFNNEVTNQSIEELYGFGYKDYIINSSNNNKNILLMYVAQIIINICQFIPPELTLKLLFDNGLETLDTIKQKIYELIDSKTSCKILEYYPLEKQINILRKGLRTGGESNYDDADIATMNTVIDNYRQTGNTEKNTAKNITEFNELEAIYNDYNGNITQ